MKTIAIVGAGHVGVTYAAGFAALGHPVRVVDIDQRRLNLLRRGRVWFHEPGLTEMLRDGLREGRLSFTTSFARALAGTAFVFVCVPTPTTPEGGLDDSALRSAFASIKQYAGTPPPVLVNKSTVPIGTGDAAATVFTEGTIRVVSNPEFLAEGRAVEDFFHPHRIIIGSRDLAAAAAVAELYRTFKVPVIVTDPVTAEMTKLASNAFLATKISFINTIARMAQHLDVDVNALSTGIGLDPRIGSGHLRAGLGFGGSCLPKDVAEIEHLARRLGAPYELFAAVSSINREQRSYWIDQLSQRLGGLAGRKVAVLGLAFKADTDDTRESPAVATASELVAQGAEVRTYDPAVRHSVTGARRARSTAAAVRGADAVIVATDWPEFASLDLRRLRRAMAGQILVDGRSLYAPSAVRNAGLEYFGFARTDGPTRLVPGAAPRHRPQSPRRVASREVRARGSRRHA